MTGAGDSESISLTKASLSDEEVAAVVAVLSAAARSERLRSADDRPLAVAAAAAVLGYVEETQKQRLPHLRGIALETSDEAIAMNAATRRHLELDSRVDGDVKATLLGVLDSTVTPMGGRLLRRWLHRPLRSPGEPGHWQSAYQGCRAMLPESGRRAARRPGVSTSPLQARRPGWCLMRTASSVAST